MPAPRVTESFKSVKKLGAHVKTFSMGLTWSKIKVLFFPEQLVSSIKKVNESVSKIFLKCARKKWNKLKKKKLSFLNWIWETCQQHVGEQRFDFNNRDGMPNRF